MQCRYGVLVAILALSLSTLLPATALGEGWLCNSEQVTGFTYEPARNEWRIARFKPRSKYAIRKPNEKGSRKSLNQYPWVIYQLGKRNPQFKCKKEFKYQILSCGLGAGLYEFKFDKKVYVL